MGVSYDTNYYQPLVLPAGTRRSYPYPSCRIQRSHQTIKMQWCLVLTYKQHWLSDCTAVRTAAVVPRYVPRTTCKNTAVYLPTYRTALRTSAENHNHSYSKQYAKTKNTSHTRTYVEHHVHRIMSAAAPSHHHPPW